jgi:hypothetical protein
MCTHANPYKMLLQVNDMQFVFPVCHVVCCDMEKIDFEHWTELVTQPVQVAFKATQLEMNVRNLTKQVEKLSKVAVKVKAPVKRA